MTTDDRTNEPIPEQVEAAAKEIAMSEEMKCEHHKLVQHRDGKPPWCRNCGLDANGNEPVSRLGL